MNNHTQIPFNFDFNGHHLRAFNIAGEPWLIAKDVCKSLELGNVSRAVETLDSDEKGMITTHTLGGPQKLLTVNESGLYELVFKSRKPDAKAFRKWVTSVVLPVLRKDGMYVVGEEHTMTDEDLTGFTKRAIEALDAKLAEKRKEIAEQAPKVASYDARWSRNETLGLTAFAKQMGLKPNKFTETLRDMGYLFNRGKTRNLPYVRHKSLFIRRDTDTGFAQTVLTQAGAEHFDVLAKDGTFDAIRAA